MVNLVIDFETRSAIKLGRGGTNAHEYASHPTTELWLGRHAFADKPEKTYPIGFQPVCPYEVRQHVEKGGIISSHNAGFEWAIWNLLLVPRYGWPVLPIEQMTDTAARAARCGLPRDLEKLGPALNLKTHKDMEGNKAMKRMARPRKVYEIELCCGMDAGASDMVEVYEQDPLTYTVIYDGDVATVYEWWAVADRIERMDTYCDFDVLTQTEADIVLPELPQKEWEIWQVTMRANIRGHVLDLDFIARAQRILDTRLAQYADELMRITDGTVKSHTDVTGMKRYCAANGVPTDSLAAAVVADLLKDDGVPANVKRVLQVRAEAGKSSVAKFPAMKMHASKEGLAHDQLVYYGAQSTGRWSALGYQLQNLPSRGQVAYDEAEWCIDLIKNAADPRDVIETIETITGMSVIEVLSMCLRGAIRSRDGMGIVCADYSNIEGRVAAWLGAEQWKLEAFKLYDQGKGPDLYKVTAGGILGIDPYEVDKTQRNVMGKVSELALGFGGGVGAYVSMGNNYGINMDDYVDTVKATLSQYWDQALENFEMFGDLKSGLSKSAWMASETIKLAWRAKHPGIVLSWYGCNDSAIAAVNAPGQAFYACDRRIAFIATYMQGKKFLRMRLPSGRCIYYANAKIKSVKTKWKTTKETLFFDKVEQGRVIPSSTWGGDIFQSAVQGTARDLMAEGWLNTDAAGYAGLFSVHDELASERKIDEVDLDRFQELLCQLPDWADGCPVTAAGYVSDRFRKD